MRYLLVGILLFALFGLFVAPAGLLKRLVEDRSDVVLLEPNGTLWNGNSQVLANGIDLGKITWNFNALALLGANIDYALTLQDAAWQLQGNAGRSFSSVNANLSGTIDSAAINRWLEDYDIFINGAVEIAPTQIIADPDNRQITYLQGQLRWQGGDVRYALSGISHQAALPPLEAYLDMNDANQPQAVVYEQGQQTPLIITTFAANGFVKVGVTKRFTQILQNPWPGSDPDHAVVIEVEEQIF
jgi:type II secretion system (T2SS) protein N